MQEFWFIIITTPPSIWAIFKILERFPKLHVKIDYVKLKMPIFGPIITKIESAKFCQFFSMTFKSGLGVLECLDSSSVTLKNKAIGEEKMKCITNKLFKVINGLFFSSSLQHAQAVKNAS